ncbi:MAG TPA: hypothetical protein VGJ09_16360 [Bryobacteraceae bacterium]
MKLLIVAVFTLQGALLMAQNATAADSAAQNPQLSDTLGSAEYLLLKVPAVIPGPLDFGQMARQKLPVFSLEGMSWTVNRFAVQGMTATDPYQPGRPVVLPDPGGVSEVRLGGRGPTLFYDFHQPAPSWHGSSSVFFTDGSLSSSNLPPPDQRGLLETSGRFHRFVHANVEANGKVTRWLDVLFSGSGRWASQTPAPADPAGRDLRSWDLYTTMRASIHPNAANHFDVLVVGARANDFAWSLPEGLEALDGRRMAPPILPQSDLREEDHLDFVQLGWNRNLLGGDFHLRYGYTTTHIDTVADQNLPATYLEIAQTHQELAYVDLATGVTHAGPLLQTQAVKPQHEGLATWRRGNLRQNVLNHEIGHAITVSATLGRSKSSNRFLNPPNALAITADGQPDSAILLHTPRTTFEDVGHFTLAADDQIRLGGRIIVDLGLSFAAWNGSLPAQGPPVDGREFQFAAQPDVITWRNAAPRAAIAWHVPGVNPLVLRAGYSRFYYPLAGRYLDFANPNSLSGDEYRWVDANQDGQFFYDETTTLLRRFGGAVSQIDPQLKPPHDDEVFVSAEVKLAGGFFARVRAFRRIEKDRIAALNTGVPFSAYQARSIVDPGADGIAGTSDDRMLTVYEQDPATFGQDHFLLTNPGLRMDQRGAVAEGGFNKRSVALLASLYVGKSWGPTNPGNDFWENDSGVVGSLYADPNTLINASGSPAMDRRFAAKVQLSFPTPRRFGKLEIMNAGVLMGGTPYARRLLVTGLDQGPLVVDATPRGTAQGYRTDPVYDWNLKVSRSFELHSGILRHGSLRMSGEVFNLLNLHTSLRVNDLTGAQFSQQLPVEMQPPRFARASISWEF